MAAITNVQLSATKTAGAGNNYDIEVTYTAVFAQFEVTGGNFRFRDGIELWEDDPVNNDRLTGLISRSVFNPNTVTVARRMTYRISASALNTELGKEELVALVRLRNLDLNLDYCGRSRTLQLPV